MRYLSAVTISLGLCVGVGADSAFTFAFGSGTFDLDDLETQLQAQGYAPGLESSELLTGVSAYRLTDGGLLLGVEIQGSGQTVFSDSTRAAVGTNTFVLQVGHTVYRSSELRVYPLVGVGRSGATIRLVRRAAKPTFDDAVAPTFRETELGAGSMNLQFALGADYHLPARRRSHNGLLVGLRLGYNLRPSDPTWQIEGEDILGGPDVDASGPFFRVLIGYGRIHDD
jgi:hypothetical protein